MKTIMLRAFMLSASVYAAPALAQDSDQMVVTTTIPPYCSELAISSTPMNLGSLTGATGQIVNAFNGTETERQLAASFYCNAPSKVTIKAEPLRHDTVTIVGDASSFTNRVDYTAQLEWSTLTSSANSTLTDATELNATQANIGALKLTLSNPTVSNNLRPIAGDYAGQVRLTISLAQ
ncbi:hypothetical protein [Sphingopyxis sp. KK2]|uniref:hypothetical protein n=1 Tax=Sphingopyxis sp. KK2 TaxID=1855727 RepID=UPI00097E6240|nr:hypothetical protein [Sphingopyxis sp. KK2]